MSLTWPTPLPASGAVVLRPFRPDDLDLVAELSLDPYIPLVSSVPSPYSEAEGRAYLARQHQRLTDGTGYSFVVADRDSDRGLGSAGLWLTGSDDSRATAGYAVAPRDRGRGLAADALSALTTFAWTLPRLHRVELYIEPENAASRRTAERCGYLCEGLLRSHQEIGGTRRDMHIYAALRSG